MGVRQWITKKVSRVVQDAVVEPVKKDVNAVKDDASEKIGLIANIARFLVCAVIGAVILKDTNEEQTVKEQARKEPTHIVINNYIHEGGRRYDYRKPDQSQKS